MVLLVFVVSLLSIGIYAYALYSGSFVAPKSRETKAVAVEQNTPQASGVANIQIVKPPEGSK